MIKKLEGDQNKLLPFSMKFRGIQCIAEDKSLTKLNFCYIKAISRNTSSINFEGELLTDVYGPYLVWFN